MRNVMSNDLQMNVTLARGEDDLTIWFPSSCPPAKHVSINGLPQCALLMDHRDVVRGFRFFSNGVSSCPATIMERAPENASCQVFLDATCDSSGGMGYVYLDKRGEASVRESIDCGIVILDLGHDGAVIGIEIFQPSKCLPALARIAAT